MKIQSGKTNDMLLKQKAEQHKEIT